MKTRLNSDDNTLSVWVASRKVYLVLTPEEWVRRHTVNFLVTHCRVQPTQICEEYPVKITGQAQRADIVVVDTHCKPLILVECKAANIEVNQEVYAQALRYNSVLAAPYIILTNGMKHFCFELIGGNYIPLKDFPQL
ncbi:MAG: type I restriction enzyme HsdR N-terminal domain-containing protein [Rikenellaceae bacterium]